MTRLRCAIPDDYFDLALSLADWSKIRDRVDITVFKQPFANEAAAAASLANGSLNTVTSTRSRILDQSATESARSK